MTTRRGAKLGANKSSERLLRADRSRQLRVAFPTGRRARPRRARDSILGPGPHLAGGDIHQVWWTDLEKGGCSCWGVGVGSLLGQSTEWFSVWLIVSSSPWGTREAHNWTVFPERVSWQQEPGRGGGPRAAVWPAGARSDAEPARVLCPYRPHALTGHHSLQTPSETARRARLRSEQHNAKK